MVDRIEFKITPIKQINTNCFRKSKYIRHNKSHSIFFNRSYFSFYLYKHDVDDLNDFEVKKMACLYVTVRINKKQKGSIEISNSVRKWYYGKNSMRDFNLSDFLDCLQIIAERLKIDLSSILHSEISLIELGANLKFLSKYQVILLSIFEHKNLKLRSTLYNNSTVYFNGVNKTIAVYDKLLERKEKNGLSDQTYKKISKK